MVDQPCTQKAQSRKKSPQTFAHPENFSKNVSMMFDNHTILLFWLQNKQTVDQVANKINKALGQVSDWCYRNGMAVHPQKSQKKC